MRVSFVCVNVGLKYGMEYVSTLFDMIARNASRLDEMAFYCLTDRPDELPEGVNAIPAPEGLPGWWAKVALFSPHMPWAVGERIVYLDLDVAITGRLEDLADTPGIMRDPLWPCLNTSVMVWDCGDHASIWEDFRPDLIDAPARIIPLDCLAAGMVNGGDQEHVTECDARAERPWRLLPSHWCLSYKLHALAWPPDACKVVIFNGEPKPAAITEGWVPDVWKIGGFTSLPEMDGVNVTYDAIYDNLRVNIPRALPWFSGGPDNSKTAVLVAGGPSMRKNLQQIKDHKRRGATIVTVNNAMRFLLDNGITSDVHVMLDARPENVTFLAEAPPGVKYMLASQCHPNLFEALATHDVCVWHNGFGDSKDLLDLIQPYWETRPVKIIPGGGTVGLRSLFLIAECGYKKVHVYGMDSSYSGDEHHAYAQPLNDADRIQEVALKDQDGGIKKYRCAPWMVRQCEEFKWHWRDLKDEGVRLFVHGEGLIPDIAKHLRAAEMAQ